VFRFPDKCGAADLRPDSDIISIGSLPYERTLHQKIALGGFSTIWMVRIKDHKLSD
jgi:hypothetical protein